MSDETSNNIHIQVPNSNPSPMEVNHVESQDQVSPEPEVSANDETSPVSETAPKKPKWHYAAAVVAAGLAGAGLYYNGTREQIKENEQVIVQVTKETPWHTPSEQKLKAEAPVEPAPAPEPPKAETPPDWRPGPITPPPPPESPKVVNPPVVVNPAPVEPPKVDEAPPPAPAPKKPVKKQIKVEIPCDDPFPGWIKAVDDFFSDLFGLDDPKEMPPKPMSKKK